MDHESLRTASTYINNLLLARGLLRNGDPIDFVKPSKDSRAQIINIVHDLILREDRGREQREHVAITLRDLRADQMKRKEEMIKMEEKFDLTQRNLTQAQVAERTAQTELKKVERSAKILQEQAAKLKTSVAQIKAQCANDVKRRDLELARLKGHLQIQQRGNRSAVVAPTMTMARGQAGRNASRAPSQTLADPEYSLKQETTEFLTQLSQSLSDENDSLISLVRGSLTTVNELLGISTAEMERHADSAIGSMHGSQDKQHQELLHSLPQSYELLAQQMQASMAQLKDVLSNPNFVNIEEVEIREEEILRLREGWEHMEKRWKDVLIMMDGWMKRINTGQSIDVEDLRRGMGLVSPINYNKIMRRASTTSLEPSFVSDEASEIQLPGSDAVISSPAHDPPRLIKPIGRTLTQRLSMDKMKKRNAIEPPPSFDLRPAQAMATRDGQTLPDRPDVDIDDVHADVSEDDAPDLTIAQKLEAARVEAQQANIVAPMKVLPEVGKATHSTTGSRDQKEVGSRTEADSRIQPSDVEIKPTLKRKATMGGRRRGRKSTLTPSELRELLAQNTAEEIS